VPPPALESDHILLLRAADLNHLQSTPSVCYILLFRLIDSALSTAAARSKSLSGDYISGKGAMVHNCHK